MVSSRRQETGRGRDAEGGQDEQAEELRLVGPPGARHPRAGRDRLRRAAPPRRRAAPPPPRVL